VKALVLYDSKYGNTELVAQAVAEALAGRKGVKAEAVRVGSQSAEALAGLDLLVIGTPVIGGRPTKAIKDFLASLDHGSMPKLRYAIFDTRMATKTAAKFGWAADRMAEPLKAADANLVGEPEGFVVTGQKGPLAEGELERAKAWGKSLAE
jgi:flavodoxin